MMIVYAVCCLGCVVIVCHFNLIRGRRFYGVDSLIKRFGQKCLYLCNILTTVSVAFSANKHQKLLPRCHGGEEITVRKIDDDQKKKTKLLLNNY